MNEDIPLFDESAPVYVYVQLADHLQKRIEEGDLRATSRLPGERALGEQYGVALGTVRRAVEELRDRKVVVTLPSKGTFIKDRAK